MHSESSVLSGHSSLSSDSSSYDRSSQANGLDYSISDIARAISMLGEHAGGNKLVLQRDLNDFLVGRCGKYFKIIRSNGKELTRILF